MSTRDKYQIIFQKSTLQTGDNYYTTITNNLANGSIAIHIGRSNLIQTNAQIADINGILSRYQNGLPFDGFWGEIDGSQLFVYPANNTVEIENATIPITDFLELLQEWRGFIGS